MYNHHFSNFGRPPVHDDLCKDAAPRHPLFWRKRFLNVFTIYGHGGYLGQWTPTILAIFHSPARGGSTWNLSNIGPEASEEKSFEILNIFHLRMCPYKYKYIGKQTWPCRKKVLSSPKICAKIQPKGILGSGEEDF